MSHFLLWAAKQKDNRKSICFSVPKLNVKVWLGHGPEQKNRQAFSAQFFCLEPSAWPVWSHSTTFVTFRSYLRIRGLLGHLVAEKLVSLCSKETENSAGAKWPCDFKEALASNLSPSLVVKAWRNSSIKCKFQKPLSSHFERTSPVNSRCKAEMSRGFESRNKAELKKKQLYAKACF